MAKAKAPQAIEYTTPHGYQVVLDSPKKLVVEQGFPCIDGGRITRGGKRQRLLVRYDNKPELAAQVKAWKAAYEKYEAEKAAEFARNVPGLKELEAAQDAADNEDYRYHHEYERAFDSEGGWSPRPIDESLREKANELAHQYPRAAMYLRAQGYTYASNFHKTAAGRKAMELIASGGNLQEAQNILRNWVPEESKWN